MERLQPPRRRASGVRTAATRLLSIAALMLAGSTVGTAGGPVTCQGPDGFGYQCSDSNSAGGPTYNWVDVSQTGQDLLLADDDQFYPITLPFDFAFYGNTYSDVAVGSNGLVYFEDITHGTDNLSIPSISPTGPTTFIAAYWDDLDPSSGGGVFYEIQGEAPDRRLVVQWDNVPLFNVPGSLRSLEVVLFEGLGDILMQYLDPGPDLGAGATVGTQGSGTVGLQYSFDTPILTPELSVCFNPPGSTNSECSPIPEPGRFALVLTSLCTLLWLARRSRSARRPA